MFLKRRISAVHRATWAHNCAIMSDVYKGKRDLQCKLNIESPSLKYVGQLYSKKALFSVDIPYPVLKSWHDIVVGLKEQETEAGKTPLTYTDLLEKSIPAGVFSFKDSPAVRSEIHESFGKLCGSITSLYRKVYNFYYFYWQQLKANVYCSPFKGIDKMIQ